MLPMTSAVQAVSPRLLPPVSGSGAVEGGALTIRSDSLRQRREAEERLRVLVGLPEVALVDVQDLSRAVEPAQCAVHEQAEILVAPRADERDRLVGELTLEDLQIARRRAARHRVEKSRPVCEERVRGPQQHPLDAFLIARALRDLGVDLELRAPFDQPCCSGRSLLGRQHPLVENLRHRRAPSGSVRRVAALEQGSEAPPGGRAGERREATWGEGGGGSDPLSAPPRGPPRPPEEGDLFPPPRGGAI